MANLYFKVFYIMVAKNMLIQGRFASQGKASCQGLRHQGTNGEQGLELDVPFTSLK